MEQEMRVLYIEGVAIHGGPEPCVGRSRGRRRSVGRGRAGWAIEPRNQGFGVPTLFRRAEGNIVGGATREPGEPRAVGEPGHVRKSPCARTGRSDDHPSDGWSGGSCGEGRGRNPVMHDRRKSDGLVLPAKPSNKAVDAVAEAVEGRGPGKGNAASETRPGLSAGVSVSSGLDRVRQVARRDKDARFTA